MKNLVTTAVCTNSTKFTFRHPCTALYVYTQITVYLCTHTRTVVDLCVHTAVCTPANGYLSTAVLNLDLHRHLRDWQQVYCTYDLIVYYTNLQKFCKQRGSTNKFDLYSNKLG